jgi:hypothetical protein
MSDDGTVLSSCTTVIMSNADPWRERAQKAVNALFDAAGTEHIDGFALTRFWGSVGIDLLRSPPIEPGEAQKLVTDTFLMKVNNVTQGQMTDRAADLVIVLLKRGSLDLTDAFQKINDMFDKELKKVRHPVQDVNVKKGDPDSDSVSMLAADSSSANAGDGAPSGDNAVAGDNAGASHSNYSNGDFGVSVKSVSSSATSTDFSGLPAVVGGNEARDVANHLAVPPAGSHNIINVDGSKTATTQGDHSGVRSRGEEEIGSGHAEMPDGKRKRAD